MRKVNKKPQKLFISRSPRKKGNMKNNFIARPSSTKMLQHRIALPTKSINFYFVSPSLFLFLDSLLPHPIFNDFYFASYFTPPFCVLWCFFTWLSSVVVVDVLALRQNCPHSLPFRKSQVFLCVLCSSSVSFKRRNGVVLRCLLLKEDSLAWNKMNYISITESSLNPSP